MNSIYCYAVDTELVQDNLIAKIKIHVKFRQVVTKTGKTETFNPEERARLDSYLDEQFEKTGNIAFIFLAQL